jgi:hypothetical protein
MKSLKFSECFAFVLGVLLTSALLAVLGVWKDEARRKTWDKQLEKNLDLSLGHKIIYSMPLLDYVSLEIESNRVEVAQRKLYDYIWWELETAWTINKKYNGVLDKDLRPLLLNTYPRIKQHVDLNHFTGWPKSTLSEMTNFVTEVDVIVQSDNRKLK